MTPFLLFLSLLLNIVALLSIIILYLRQNRLVEVEHKQEKMIKEMEEVISTYLIEMKEENETFIKKVQGLNTRIPHNRVDENKQISENTPNIEEALNVNRSFNESPSDQESHRFGRAMAFHAVKAYQTQVGGHSNDKIQQKQLVKVEEDMVEDEKDTPAEQLNNPSDVYRESLLNQIYKLKDQGFSDEEIAKKLDKGKTEIELLLKFRQK